MAHDTIIDGELIDNDWFLSAINDDLEYIKANAQKNVGKTGQNNCTALMYAADMNRNKCIKYLLKFKEEIAKQDLEGNTALMYAAKKGHIKSVKLLAEYESNIINKSGEKAIDLAKKNGFWECVDFLIDFEEENEDSGNNADTGESDNSNGERNLIKENRRLRRHLKVLKSANKTVDVLVSVDNSRIL